MKLELQNVSKKFGAEDHLYPLELTLTSGLNVLLPSSKMTFWGGSNASVCRPAAPS